ncbi:vanadium-dependent haloperoxidase [Rhizobium sp. C1]|uniref:vanadium-dependent haloperoxidase n=1 Tax=Rhizobium sp. C1 TaxID=1349799 RepID=UPI001E55A61F|nr:vanadium-dependent haloperoxidase [Rhizobium sp. C1]MCD2179776.1 vanadium-dependent haloperoxidase [Rhizobium sp. C1]
MSVVIRRAVLGLVFACSCLLSLVAAAPTQAATPPQAVVTGWYKLILELVRHTSNYSPPVAARSFAYIGVTSYEAVASGSDNLQSLAGQLNRLKTLPSREKGAIYDDAVILNTVMEFAVTHFFDRTGPTGQHVMKKMAKRMDEEVTQGVAPDVVTRSRAYGQILSQAVFDWSQTDGGATVENMGFPLDYKVSDKPGHWVPTSLIRQQQAPLLPEWGKVLPLAMPAGSTCRLSEPPEYSEKPDSAFYKDADEVYAAVKGLTDEHRTIARFWSDDPMLSPTPPGHWINIALIVLDQQKADLPTTVDTLARLGVALSDAFIGCWDSKFEFDLIRPITYIKKNIDPNWDALLITPPFPEYPSGHSTQSGAAASAMTHIFGKALAFDDSTHEADGIKPRHFANFRAAAEEAAISRLYGGIHFRPAIERGLTQGECIANYVNALKTKK